MLNLITKLAVSPSSDPTEVARLTNVMEGVDGASVMGLELEAGEIRIEDNSMLDVYHDYTLDVRVLDASPDTDNLETWAQNQDKCYIAGLTPNGFMVFNQPTLINRHRQYNDVVLALALKASLRTLQNYGTGEQNVYVGGNLLAIYDIVNTVDGLSTRMNGIVPNVAGIGYSTSTDGDGFTIQQLTRTSGTTAVPFKDIFFPFEGSQLTFTVEVTSGSGAIIIQYLNGNFVPTGSPQDQSATTGTRSVTATAPANARFVRVSVNTTGSISFKKPRLRLMGQTEFVM